jgi:uncharacterized protein YndB with AHSA1/START domain
VSAGDAVRVTSRVEVDPDTAFRVFTREVDAWWRTGPRFRWHPERGGTLRFEGEQGGRFVEIYPDGECFEVGTIRVWDPPRRLVFGFRAKSFATGECTEVEVRFEPNGDATDVTVVHRGFAALRGDHPARHGLGAGEFENMMGTFWADLLTAARRHASARRAGGRTT